MNPAGIILLLIIAGFLGMLGLGVKQGLQVPNNQVVIATQPNQPVLSHNSIGTATTTTENKNQTTVYSPGAQNTIAPSSQTLLEKAHQFAYKEGITSFASMVDFKPEEPLSREGAAKMFSQFAKLIYQENYYKNITPDSNCLFIDKSDIEPALFRDVIEACSFGFMSASQGRFSPKTHLTHEQAHIILSRITQIPNQTGSSLAITRGGLIELMLDQYLLRKSQKH